MSASATPAEGVPTFKIIEFRAENIKRLEVVSIVPVGQMVEITGKNGAGKTSVLDAIFWALDGARHIQKEPIRRGQDSAFVELNLGAMVVRRELLRTPEGITTKLIVTNAEGFAARKPQVLIDSFFSALSMDPLEFLRMDTKKQFELLRAFVPDVDFERITQENERDYKRRTEYNAAAKQARAMAARINPNLAEELATTPLDIAAMEAALEEAGKHNSTIDLRKARRENMLAQAEAVRKSAAEDSQRAEDLVVQSKMALQAALAKIAQADEMEAAVTNAPPLPEPIDTTAMRNEINVARGLNTKIEVRAQHQEVVAEAERLEKQSEQMTANMADRLKAANEQIAAAKLPVAELTITPEGLVMLAGFPFSQASDAQQLRASIELAMALNPRLRVIRVRDGSLLDDDGMALVRDMAERHGYQVWIERVGSDAATGFELVEGRIKPAAAQEPTP